MTAADRAYGSRIGAACAIVAPITIIVIAMRNKFAASFRCHFIAASLSKRHGAIYTPACLNAT